MGNVMPPGLKAPIAVDDCSKVVENIRGPRTSAQVSVFRLRCLGGGRYLLAVMDWNMLGWLNPGPSRELPFGFTIAISAGDMSGE